MQFYNNLYIRINYYINKKSSKYKLIYPGREFNKILELEKEAYNFKNPLL
jgi:hypothetical protein